MSEIDVSKCEYYNFGECTRYGFPLSCAKCSDCYYKQLQKLKEENEDLRNKNKSIHSIADDLQQRNHNLTLENEELKKQIAEDLCYEDKSKKCNKAFYIDKINKKKLEKAEQCLDEIEKIANTETCYKCPCEKPCMDDKHASCEYIRFEQISQLIRQQKEGNNE